MSFKMGRMAGRGCVTTNYPLKRGVFVGGWMGGNAVR